MAAMVTSNVLIRNTQDGVGNLYTSYYGNSRKSWQIHALMERLLTIWRTFAMIIIYILYKSCDHSRREGILIVLLSPKAQRDGERKSVQIKRVPTDKREEHWDTESKLRPHIQTSSKAKYSDPMTDYKEYTSRKRRGSTKKGNKWEGHQTVPDRLLHLPGSKIEQTQEL